MLVNTDDRLLARAMEVFQDTELAQNWIRTPSRLFEDKSPLEALETPEGRARVDRQLNWFAGRPSLPGE